MEIQKIITKRKAELIRALDQYLSDELAHQEINDSAWDIITQGEGIPKSEPYEKGEDVFWFTIWAIQHLADEEHVGINSSKDELTTLLKLLKSGGPLPDGWEGRRPK